jgi:predicted deacylase
MNIFDIYSASELRDIFRDSTDSWPESFCSYVNRELAESLLDIWLDNHSDKEYREEVREIIENLTYGYEDENGNEMFELT